MYTGRRLDTETGLYYYRARYYCPNLRRFIETDPISYSGGMNLYAYVGNSSVNFVDPTGLDSGYVIVQTANGKSSTLTDPTAQEFVSFMNQQEDGSITNLEFRAHGNRWAMGLQGRGKGGDSLVYHEDSSAVVIDRDSDYAEPVIDLFKKKMSKDGSIFLFGCNTAREAPWGNYMNIAKLLSAALPGRTVSGLRGFGFNLEFIGLGRVGLKRSYLNGNRL